MITFINMNQDAMLIVVVDHYDALVVAMTTS